MSRGSGLTTVFRTITAELEAERTVLWLTLNQPRGNILTIEMVGELRTALAAHRDVPELKLVVLHGAGGNFSYGASIEEHRQEFAPAMLAGFHQFIRSLAAFPVPTAALVEGNCLGGGFEVAICCHFMMATSDARFACPEIKLGVFPPVLAAVGAQRLGGFTAERLLLTGDSLSAEEAERLGYLSSLIKAEEDAKTACLSWYHHHLEPLSAFALRQANAATRQASGFLEVLDRALHASERLYLERLLPSYDGNEGIEAFLEKRPPQWQDR